MKSKLKIDSLKKLNLGKNHLSNTKCSNNTEKCDVE